MRIRLAAFVGLAFLLFATLPAQAPGTPDQFRSKEGEPVIVWHHAIKPGHLEQAEGFFTKTLIPLLKADNQTRDNYFLVNKEGTEIVSFSFYGANDTKDTPHAGAVSTGMKPHTTRNYRQAIYKIVLLRDEGLQPRVGDKVVLIERPLKPGKLEDAKKAFREVIFPHLAQDENKRDSYLLENAKGDELLSLVFLRGEFTVSPAMAEKRKKHVHPNLEKPEKETVYTIFATHNE